MRRLEGGRAHFHLYSSQFVSKSQTVWDGDLPKCNKVSNFFIWLSDNSNARFCISFFEYLEKMAVLGPLQRPLLASLFEKTENFSFSDGEIL